MRNMLLCLGLFILLIPLNAFSQDKTKEIELHSIPGEAIGTENESLKEVRAKAVNQAKVNALKEAGIQENISTYTDYFQSETDEEYEELFASSVFTNVQGAVKNVQIVDTEKKFTADNTLKVQVRINCTVIKYLTEDDLSFDFEVNGIKSNYNHNDLLKFEFIPHQNGYLRAFIFTKEESYQLYPNDYEESRLFQKDTRYQFPLAEINYRLESQKRSDMHRAVFVFMKKDIPYLEEVKYEEIFDWIFSIPPDVRKVKSFSFTLFNDEVD